MYGSCIFCSAALGSNESIERFPVGRTLAFDAAKGRLWAVCPKCARWNLAPIEERWEAVEDAERLFCDTRLRVQNENVGLAKLRDGTRLVRVGQALPRELAVWRYGRKLLRRRAMHAAVVGVAAGVPVAAIASVATGFVAGAATFLLLSNALLLVAESRPRLQSRSLLPYSGLDVDAADLARARFAFTFGGEVSVELKVQPGDHLLGLGAGNDELLVLDAEHGRVLLRRGMVALNASGAAPGQVESAVNLLTASGSADRFLRRAAADRVLIQDPALDGRLRKVHMLAMEMAVHDELERDAMQGELAALEAAWRQAEEIAGIADALPDMDPEPPRLGAAS
jgi:hypothetical protein